MRRFPWLLLLPLLVLGCERDQPQRVENPNLGIKVTFPGPSNLNKYLDQTPFGTIEWFDNNYYPGGRLDESFHVAVGNLPPGKEGGDTPEAVLATFRKELERRQGPLETTDLPKEKGPGFSYRAAGPQGTTVAGILVVRRGRLHHAQATVAKAADPRLKAFLDSFEVAP